MSCLSLHRTFSQQWFAVSLDACDDEHRINRVKDRPCLASPRSTTAPERTLVPRLRNRLDKTSKVHNVEADTATDAGINTAPQESTKPQYNRETMAPMTS